MSTIASHSLLNISETFRDKGKGPLIGNDQQGIEWSRDRWRYVTLKGQVVTQIRLKPNISKTAGDDI